MGLICPTVLADTVEEYREQMEAIAPFASRIQIDLGDGDFTGKTVSIADVWWPKGVSPDIHLMYQSTSEAVQALVLMKPRMIILHAESGPDLSRSIAYAHERGIQVGIALLQGTSVEEARSYIEVADHVLIFSGSLGSFGGKADLSLLRKVPQIRAIKQEAEIGWDGGANLDNVTDLCRGGIDVVNVGSAIQKTNHPENAYRALQRQAYH